MNTRPLVVLGDGNGIDTSGTLSSGSLLVLSLILVDLLSITGALLVELLVLGSDLLSAVLRVTTAAAGTEFMLVDCHFKVCTELGGTHVSSTFMRRGGYLPSSKVEWW